MQPECAVAQNKTTTFKLGFLPSRYVRVRLTRGSPVSLFYARPLGMTRSEFAQRFSGAVAAESVAQTPHDMLYDKVLPGDKPSYAQRQWMPDFQFHDWAETTAADAVKDGSERTAAGNTLQQSDVARAQAMATLRVSRRIEGISRNGEDGMLESKALRCFSLDELECGAAKMVQAAGN